MHGLQLLLCSGLCASSSKLTRILQLSYRHLRPTAQRSPTRQLQVCGTHALFKVHVAHV